MPRDKTDSHERILEAARAEFEEHGFGGASMRRIGSRAGMTAAGIYRHFPSKDALFDALVGPAVNDIYAWLDAHVARATSAVDEGGQDLWADTEIDMMREVVYPRMGEYRLLVNKAQGSRYQDFLHDLAVDHQERMSSVFPMLRQLGYGVRDVTEQELHLLLTAYCSALFEPVIHDYSFEEAMSCLDTVEAFFLPGWRLLLGF